MAIKGIRTGFAQLLRLVLGALIVALIGLEVVQVLLRYFFSDGIIWGRDVSTLMMFSIAWVGASLAWLDNKHLSVDLLPAALTAGRAWSVFLNAIMVAVALGLLVITRMAAEGFATIDLPSLGVSAAIKFWPMTAGAWLLALAAMVNLLDWDPL